MRYRVWLSIDGTRRVVGSTDNKRDAHATVRTLGRDVASFEDTINEED